MAIHNLVVTIGGSATQVSAASIRCNWVTFQNNDAHAMAVGGSDAAVGTGASAKGVQLAVGGSNYQARSYIGQENLAFWYVAGTNGEHLTVTYSDGVDNLP